MPHHALTSIQDAIACAKPACATLVGWYKMLHSNRHTPYTLVASRSKHMALFDGVSGVREWMAAAYKPELAATLGSCMQDMMHGLKTGLEGQPNVTPAS